MLSAVVKGIAWGVKVSFIGSLHNKITLFKRFFVSYLSQLQHLEFLHVLKDLSLNLCAKTPSLRQRFCFALYSLYNVIVRDSEPIKLPKTLRSLSVSILR